MLKKSIPLFLLLISISFLSFSQEDEALYSNNYIQRTNNKDSAFNSIRQKIENINQNQVRVLHLTDNKTLNEKSIESFYNQLITEFNTKKLSSMHWDAPLSVSSQKKTTINLFDSKNNSNNLCQKFRIYHSKLYPNMEIILANSSVSYKTTYNEEGGYTTFELKKPVRNLQIELINNSNYHLVYFGFYIETTQNGFLFDVFANNLSNYYFYDRDSLLKKHISTMDFDMVVLSYGATNAYTPMFNPVNFEESILNIINTIREIKSNVPILITTPLDYKIASLPNKRLKSIDDILNRIANENSCYLWDFYQIMGGMGACESWMKGNLMDKRASQLTQRGLFLQGKLLGEAFLDIIK
ncbi:MAG: hypothetical protein LBM25_08175 [Bacteroidales bacterium]|jgi:hypothetical protein|nr:hypothetical protein [Bacteroidales bacterium]